MLFTCSNSEEALMKQNYVVFLGKKSLEFWEQKRLKNARLLS